MSEATVKRAGQRRNVTPETASKLRAEYHESMSKGRGAREGNQNASKQKSHYEAFVSEDKSTAEVVAEQTGTSRAPAKRQDTRNGSKRRRTHANGQGEAMSGPPAPPYRSNLFREGAGQCLYLWPFLAKCLNSKQGNTTNPPERGTPTG